MRIQTNLQTPREKVQESGTLCPCKSLVVVVIVLDVEVLVTVRLLVVVDEVRGRVVEAGIVATACLILFEYSESGLVHFNHQLY